MLSNLLSVWIWFTNIPSFLLLTTIEVKTGESQDDKPNHYDSGDDGGFLGYATVVAIARAACTPIANTIGHVMSCYAW